METTTIQNKITPKAWTIVIRSLGYSLVTFTCIIVGGFYGSMKAIPIDFSEIIKIVIGDPFSPIYPAVIAMSPIYLTYSYVYKISGEKSVQAIIIAAALIYLLIWLSLILIVLKDVYNAVQISVLLSLLYISISTVILYLFLHLRPENEKYLQTMRFELIYPALVSITLGIYSGYLFFMPSSLILAQPWHWLPMAVFPIYAFILYITRNKIDQFENNRIGWPLLLLFFLFYVWGLFKPIIGIVLLYGTFIAQYEAWGIIARRATEISDRYNSILGAEIIANLLLIPLFLMLNQASAVLFFAFAILFMLSVLIWVYIISNNKHRLQYYPHIVDFLKFLCFFLSFSLIVIFHFRSEIEASSFGKIIQLIISRETGIIGVVSLFGTLITAMLKYIKDDKLPKLIKKVIEDLINITGAYNSERLLIKILIYSSAICAIFYAIYKTLKIQRLLNYLFCYVVIICMTLGFLGYNYIHKSLVEQRGKNAKNEEDISIKET